MKRKISIGLNIVLFFACVCSLAFGVYAAQTAKLDISGSLGLTAHDCKVSVSASIYGHSTSVHSEPILEANAVSLASNLLIDGTVSNLTLRNVYFSDLGAIEKRPSDITIVINVTNESEYFPVLIEDATLETTYTNYKLACSNPLHVLYTNTEDNKTTITYRIIPVANSSGEYVNISTLVPISLSLKFSKLNTDVSSEGFTFSGTSITGVPENTNSDTVIIPSTFTDKAGTYTTIGNSSGSTAIANIANYKKVILLKGLTTINNYSFRDSTNLTSVALPSSLNSIGDEAFYECTSLVGITIPSGVTSTGMGTFSGCSGLKSVNLSHALTGIGIGVFAGCTNLTNITIPEGVDVIDNAAFAGCTNLTSLTIPSKIWYIGGGAFQDCTSLASISIPNVEQICANAFQNCTSLTSISIPSSVNYWDEYSFSGCSSLTSVNISPGVTSIPDHAFRGCTSLTSIIIPSSVTSIGTYAFHSCISLTSIIIPSSVTRIGTYVFGACTSLTSISIPSSVTSIDNCAFIGCSLTSITIPEGVTSIGDSAFDFCIKLTSVTIPSSVTSIGANAFQNCGNLTKAVFTDTTTWWVGASAGTKTTKLTSANLANTYTAATYLKTTHYSKYWTKV